MNADSAPGGPETTVRAALRARDATRALADATLEPVPGGLSNYAWKAEHGGRSWFVRLGGPESATLGVDRWSECALLGLVSSAGLAPPLIACEPANGLLVTHFIPGETWRREDAHQARNIERVAERLRVLHGLVAPTDVGIVDFAARARSLEAQLRATAPLPASSPGAGAGVEELIHAARAREEEILGNAAAAIELLDSRRSPLVPCHNDLHHLNLVDDGDRLWIVDWEYGGVGDPLFDLASLACQHEYTGSERAALLDAYDRGAGMEATMLDAACTVFDCVQWLWYLAWAARNPAAGHECATRATVLAGRLAASGR
ncbi:MAG: choline kinase family protein [Steroidobacteraceae bacterium]|nr:choline kinase family protein [Steroidobacteraceae bacterium]